MIRGHSELLGRQVEAEDGEPGVHRYITVALEPDGTEHVVAWLTLDGAYEAEAEGEARGLQVEVIEAEG